MMSTSSPGVPVPERDVYARLGDEGFARLARAFYALVPSDDILGPMYAVSIAAHGEDLFEAEQRLRDFLIFRFGGPDRYIQARGHPRLRARHMPFVIDERAARRWLTLMQSAMVNADIAPDIQQTLLPYFEHTALFMVNQPKA